VATGRAAVAVERRAPVQFGLSTIMLTITLVAVFCGVFAMSPGLGVALGIVSAPALIRTYLVVLRRKQKGERVSAIQKAGMYLGSVAVVSIIFLLLFLASFGTFFAVCLGTWAAVEDEETALWMAGFAALFMTSLAAFVSSLWVRHRWRKAVGGRERRSPFKD
jgi:hypothetical protein